MSCLDSYYHYLSDWFIKAQAQLHFDSNSLILPHSLPIQMVTAVLQHTEKNNTLIAIVSKHTREEEVRHLTQQFHSYYSRKNRQHRFLPPSSIESTQALHDQFTLLHDGVPLWNMTESTKQLMKC